MTNKKKANVEEREKGLPLCCLFYIIFVLLSISLSPLIISLPPLYFMSTNPCLFGSSLSQSPFVAPSSIARSVQTQCVCEDHTLPRAVYILPQRLVCPHCVLTPLFHGKMSVFFPFMDKYWSPPPWKIDPKQFSRKNSELPHKNVVFSFVPPFSIDSLTLLRRVSLHIVRVINLSPLEKLLFCSGNSLLGPLEGETF